ncbi:hypothetical protein [Haemophilus sp. HMSC068C11]|jgi:hypothetical protein|uniref:DUF7657 domain-containing protein n=1 Tax=Haemophilus sp. HMSC068C11 TaxID=1739522 RepID=UPI000AF2FABD|nr:hypothetical protein [Haemophilus sp. HMSC068C11]
MQKFVFKQININHIYWLYAIWLILNVSFALSPSSYGMALDAFGIDYNTVFGLPRPIRSDEWAVWTPYTQMAVNNDFERYYQSGLYQIDLRNFNQIPLLDWSLVFKPLIWGYFILPPAYAFSLFYALLTISFVVGWEKVIARFIGDVPNQRIYAITFTFLIYFTGYVQYWWTTTGPLLALTPWLILAIYNQSRWRYIWMFYIAIAWLLSHTYPPIIVTLTYLSAGFVITGTKSWNKQVLADYAIKVVVCGLAAAVILLYYQDVIKVMGETVYPGKRVVSGGSVPLFIWLASIFPFIAQSNYQELLLNICEVGTGASFLPLLAACFVNNKREMCKHKSVYIWFILFALFSLWMLFPFPAILGKVTLFSLVLENRMTFAAGFALNLAALCMLVHGKINLSLNRITIFIFAMIAVYSLATWFGYITFAKKSAWEFILVPLVLALLFIPKWAKVGLVGSAAAINMLYNFSFNPIMPAKPIFDIINSPTTQAFNTKKESSGWVVEPGYLGATLSGIGVDSFTNVLMQPQFEIFRKIYPKMSDDEFNQIFNRYAHIHLTEDNLPYVAYPDDIRIPLKDISSKKVLQEEVNITNSDLNKSDLANIPQGGYIDNIRDIGDNIVISGWAMSDDKQLSIIGLSAEKIKGSPLIPRQDVVKVLNDSKLLNSGFQVVISKSDLTSPICLISRDTDYGNKQLAPPAGGSAYYQCTELPQTK